MNMIVPCVEGLLPTWIIGTVSTVIYYEGEIKIDLIQTEAVAVIILNYIAF